MLLETAPLAMAHGKHGGCLSVHHKVDITSSLHQTNFQTLGCFKAALLYILGSLLDSPINLHLSVCTWTCGSWFKRRYVTVPGQDSGHSEVTHVCAQAVTLDALLALFDTQANGSNVRSDKAHAMRTASLTAFRTFVTHPQYYICLSFVI